MWLMVPRRLQGSKRFARRLAEHHAFGDNNHAVIGDGKTVAVGFEIVTDNGARRDFDVFVDDGAPDLAVPTHFDIVEQDAVVD